MTQTQFYDNDIDFRETMDMTTPSYGRHESNKQNIAIWYDTEMLCHITHALPITVKQTETCPSSFWECGGMFASHVNYTYSWQYQPYDDSRTEHHTGLMINIRYRYHVTLC